MLSIAGGLFLGWSLGANDASNVFGTAVSSRMIRFWTAAVLAALFVVLGAVISGQAGIETLKGLTNPRPSRVQIPGGGGRDSRYRSAESPAEF
ncbi:MAG: inorganic phosphate transporter [Deltaproteobacteria bacterium]